MIHPHEMANKKYRTTEEFLLACYSIKEVEGVLGFKEIWGFSLGDKYNLVLSLRTTPLLV